MNRVYQKGFVNSGATLAAGLLEFENDAHLTNEWLGNGTVRWWELVGGNQFWRPRTMPADTTLPFPYGFAVTPP